ncbi:MAG: hypothetical protein IJ133_01425 [Clostridia bacterium]|nr:hypothetical protein [Clostridia bacterium]
MTKLNVSNNLPAILAAVLAVIVFFGLILAGFALTDHFIYGALNVAAIPDTAAQAANIAAAAIQ